MNDGDEGGRGWSWLSLQAKMNVKQEEMAERRTVVVHQSWIGILLSIPRDDGCIVPTSTGIWSQGILDKEKMYLIADCYGFRPEWDKWTDNPENAKKSSQYWLNQLTIMKIRNTNKGIAFEASNVSPREGIHRFISHECIN